MTKHLFILLSLLGCAEIISASQVISPMQAIREKALNFERKPQSGKISEPLFMSQINKKKRSEQDKKMEIERSIQATNALQKVTPNTSSEVIDSGEYVAPVRIGYLSSEAAQMLLHTPDSSKEKAKKDKAAVRGAVASQENQTISFESLLLNIKLAPELTPKEKSEITVACQNIFGPRPARKKPVATEIAWAVYDAQKTKPATAEALDISIPSLKELLDGQEMKNVGPRVVERFQKLREDRELTKEWGLDEDTISRLGRLIKEAREAAAIN